MKLKFNRLIHFIRNDDEIKNAIIKMIAFFISSDP